MFQKNLYEILGVSECASASLLKSQYRALALSLHPDHNTSPEATQQFQTLAQAYQILSNPQTRALYDMGHYESQDHATSVHISMEDIDAYLATYIGSETEVQDVLAAYDQHRGNMFRIMSSVPFADVANFERLTTLIESHTSSENQHYARWRQSLIPSRRRLQKFEQQELRVELS